MIGFTRQGQKEEQRYKGLKLLVEQYLEDDQSDNGALIRDVKRACKEIRETYAERSAHLEGVEESLS